MKQNLYHDYYLSMVESRKKDSGFKRSTILVFDSELEDFLTAFELIYDNMQKKINAPPYKIVVGDGRREYKFSMTHTRRKAVQVTERREDSNSVHQDSIFIEIETLDAFLKTLKMVIIKVRQIAKSPGNTK